MTPVALPGAHDSAPDDWAQSPAFAHRHLKAVRSRQPPRRWLPLRGEKGQQVGGFGRYLKNVGIGTMIATMLPYSLAFLVAWSGLLILWIVLNLPMGPGSGLFLPKP